MEIREMLVNAKDVEWGKIKFVACTSNIGGKWYKVKFRRDCQNAPTTKGRYEIKIDLAKCSVQAGKKFTRKDGTEGVEDDIIWVSEIVSIEKVSQEKLQEENAKRLSALFDGEQLPF